MAIYKTHWFDRWAKKQGLSTQALCKAVREMSDGLFEADLGGGLFKKRVARQGQGKSSGFRTLVATNKGSRWIFVFGFSKNARSNIDKDEEEALKNLAAHLLSLSPQAIEIAQSANELIEVNCNEKNKVSDT
ncbi:type II toxin-antitoxin system RelE/ParE family toxin [Methylobacter sp.]|uniref:type II toxin-antitoxin system RelE/ParE family toxin n=1 Tax=Methylobacter sp. TaxID=2051955 RepID=UPI00121CA2A0|nr:type II toxin-antitoxin system RelE/ParE family toxin [Methylobacter sp.]TAK60381.1 MAG: type II toxin-antitoxin system RelE/ParE family toxin [Methylobacter sp.]